MEKSAVKWILDIIKTVVVAVLVSMVLVLIFALIVKATNINDKAILYINQGIKIVSILVGSIVGYSKGGKLGWLKGLICGLLYVIVSFLVFSLISGNISMSNLGWLDFVTGAIVGILCGIIAVNVKKSKQNA